MIFMKIEILQNTLKTRFWQKMDIIIVTGWFFRVDWCTRRPESSTEWPIHEKSVIFLEFLRISDSDFRLFFSGMAIPYAKPINTDRHKLLKIQKHENGPDRQERTSAPQHLRGSEGDASQSAGGFRGWRHAPPAQSNLMTTMKHYRATLMYNCL